MTRLRTLAWLIALIAFVVPSFGTAMVSHAMAPAMELGAQGASADCPDHAPPPDCPAQGTAKHAAGQCCPQMAGVVALLLPGAVAEVPARFHARVIAAATHLTSLFLAHEPPPPRV